MEFKSCKNDKAFKCVFLNPLNQNLLSLIIKEVTKEDYNNITYSNIEKNVHMAIRRKYLDVLLDSTESVIGIEVNGFNNNYVHPRNTAFVYDNYSNHILVNEKYTEDKMILQINFSYGLTNTDFISKYMIRNEKKSFVKNFIIYEVNMDYYLDFWYNRNKKGANIENIIKYRYFIMQALNLEELQELIEITKDERIVKFMEELKKVNEDPKFREYITEEQDKEFIMNTLKKETRKEGEISGEIRGKLKEKMETAKKLLSKHFSIKDIIDITGLSAKEIKSICL